MAASSAIPSRLRAQLSGDVVAVADLVEQIKKFFSAFPPGTDTDQIAPSAEQYFAWTKSSWEQTHGPKLVDLTEVDAAETFVVEFFTPLLEANQLADQLTDPTIFGTQALLEVPSAGPSLQPSGRLTQASFTGPPVANFLLVYAGVFTWFHDLLLSQGLPLNVADAVASYTMGTFLVCSFPVWTVYHELHGKMTFDRVLERLQESIDECQDFGTTVLSAVQAAPRPTTPIDSAQTVSLWLDILAAALRNKSGDLPAFAALCQQVNATRIMLPAGQLNADLKADGFWKEGAGSKTVVNYGQIPEGTPAANVLNYVGNVGYAANQTVQDRSFWAPRSTWTRLTWAAQLISQAGFHTYVTAVDNPYAGRHPPHLTHRDGYEVDLVWTVTSDPGDTVPDLAQSNIRYGNGVFFDVDTQRYFDVAPVNKNKAWESVSHTGLAALSTLVVLQAIALAEFARYLYLDFLAMRFAGRDLALALEDKSLNPFANGRRGSIPVVEGLGHYNHLHVEAPTSQANTPKYFTQHVLTILYHLALIRDDDTKFLDSMFQPPDVVFPTKVQESAATAFAVQWTTASNQGQPSLLPVWLSKKIRDRLEAGEKIGKVLGIDV